MSLDRRLEKLESVIGKKVMLLCQYNLNESPDEAMKKAEEAYQLDGGNLNDVALRVTVCNYAKRAIPGKYTIFDHA